MCPLFYQARTCALHLGSKRPLHFGKHSYQHQYVLNAYISTKGIVIFTCELLHNE